ncbi:MAG: hypothetical protein AB7F39_06725 [Variibacter sp.]
MATPLAPTSKTDEREREMRDVVRSAGGAQDVDLTRWTSKLLDARDRWQRRQLLRGRTALNNS